MATRPGFHDSTNFSSYPDSLSLAIRSIGRDFYVTRSFPSVEIGNSRYWGLIARPAEDFSIHLNADRELLFLFSNYSTFETRTLEAFDEFYDQLDQKRLDKSIRFLISGDRRIEEKIQHYLQQNPEYPIIVPIYLPRIGGGADEILNAVRNNYLLRDLFGYQNPLREETFFFGRQKLVNTILDLAKSGQSSSIFGLRKSGKTSTIYAIARRSKSFDCIPVSIDCQSPAIHARNYAELLTHLLSEIKTSIGQKKKTITLSGTDAEIAVAFRDQIKSALGQAKRRVLVIFDEIENITPGTAASGHWNTGTDSLLFWQNIRSVIQQGSGGKLAICIVGTSPSLLELPKLSDVANPMYLFTQKRFIPAFSFEETMDMIQRLGFFMGLEFDPTQISNLQRRYGGHPFFIRQVCSNLHGIVSDIRPVKVSDRHINEAIDKFGGQLDHYLENILTALNENYPDEFSLLRAIVNGDKSEISEYGREAPELIDHLIGYGLVERRGEEVDIRFDAVSDALKKVFRCKNTEDLWSECNVRRNIIEVEIRRELLFYSKSLKESEWSSLLEEALSGRRYSNLDSIEPKRIFSRSQSPLYWTDLMSILKLDRVFPYLGDRKGGILNAMNTVNSLGRKDAHANELSASEFAEIVEAFEVLESEFHPPA